MYRDDETRQAYVTQLRHEHERLEERLLQIEHLWAPPHGPPASRDQLLELLAQLELLLAQLDHHFREEDEGGCLEEAASRDPKLCHRVNCLEHDHPGLLAELETLVSGVRTLTQPRPNVDELRRGYMEFARALREHEHTEDQILAEGFRNGDNGSIEA
jgi:iron-sulfur cluster repair protein YtfE (RIC family)